MLEKCMVGNIPPPDADKYPHVLRHNGNERVDPYYWLRDDERKNEKVLDYLRAENDYADALLAPLGDLQKQIFDELRARIKEDDETVPYRMGRYMYNVRFVEGREYPIHVRRPLSHDDGEHEQVLIDENERAEPHSYYSLTGVRLSPNESLVAVGEDTVGRRICSIRVYNIDTREWSDVVLEGTTGSVAWSSDSRQLLYIKRHPTTLRAYQVWRHTLGEPSEQEELIFEEKDEEFLLSIRPSRTKRYIFITSHQTTCSEVRFLEAANTHAEPRLVLARERNHEYSVDHAGDHFFIRTNLNAENFKLVTATDETLRDTTKWVDKIPAREDTLFVSAELFRDTIASLERNDANTRLVLYPVTEGTAKPIDFDEEVYVAGIGINREWDATSLRMSYQSPTTPATIIDYEFSTGSRTVLKQEQVLGGFSPSNYVTRRLHATARDGEQVPLSLVYHKDIDRSRPNALYLYGYGAYGSSMDAWFSRNRLTLLDRGLVYAIAHVRGGQEKARRWYRDGKLLNKMNSFSDFIDCAEYLVEEGWTEPKQLVASGGSAGGLLVGAVANMRPDLFRMIVAAVPFVDVVTTMLDETIPLTTFEYDEWGNPNDPAFYEYMLRYSPYDNVKDQAYPDIFVRTGLHDSQVQYWEPAKWVAKLRDHQRGNGKILLKTNMEVGHSGASGRFSALVDLATEYAWVLHRLGKVEKIQPVAADGSVSLQRPPT